jgi:hypothetical protein
VSAKEFAFLVSKLADSFYRKSSLKIKDFIRTLLGIRQTRRRLPPGRQPVVGSNIVRETLRIHLKYPINKEQWDWLTEIGWRTIDMRNTRRQYVSVEDRAVRALLRAPGAAEREKVHQAILDVAEKLAARELAKKKRK